jgi:predicted RNA-binding Zn-ribbon protein involved in translation (DUF1610 family)
LSTNSAQPSIAHPGGISITKADSEKSSNRTIFDQKCVTCGTWMDRIENKNKNAAITVTYSCPECGLSYTVDE